MLLKMLRSYIIAKSNYESCPLVFRIIPSMQVLHFQPLLCTVCYSVLPIHLPK